MRVSVAQELWPLHATFTAELDAIQSDLDSHLPIVNVTEKGLNC